MCEGSADTGPLSAVPPAFLQGQMFVRRESPGPDAAPENEWN